MRRTLLILLAMFVCAISKGQKSKSVFLEVGGNGGAFSVNFDSRLSDSEKGLGYRAGVGFIPPSYVYVESRPTTWTIPVGVNYLFGRRRHYLETGLGLTPYFFNGTVSDVMGIQKNDKGIGMLLIPSAGYRYAPPGKAFQGRLFVSPLIGSGGADFYWGLSGGYKF
jgi:hypothetical protein